MPASASMFRRSAVLSKLVSSDQLDEALRSLGAQQDGLTAAEVDDQRVAQRLIEQKVLTQYQVEQLFAGRTKFTLGPYLVIDSIGRGGMGEVYKGIHEIMGREVAIKVLPRSRSTPEAIAAFNREIRTQAQLDHAHLVRAYDAGHDGNVYYLVTEYVPGSDLRRLVRGEGALDMRLAASIVMQAAKGLQYAHERGLIHRDVKPGNILVTPQGMAKVSDLGLANCLGDDTDPRAGKVVGTADYLSPEQIKAPREITPASDIYSLGCTLYYAVTGKVPFPGGSAGDKARRHCLETPWHPRRFNPELSEEFVEVVADMMEKDPKLRIASAADLVTRLEPWASEAPALSLERLSRSPWMPPPLPTGSDDEEYDTRGEAPIEPEESHEQSSQGAATPTATADDTSSAPSIDAPMRTILPPPHPEESEPTLGHDHSTLALVAVAAGSVGLLLGGLLMWLLMS